MYGKELDNIQRGVGRGERHRRTAHDKHAHKIIKTYSTYREKTNYLLFICYAKKNIKTRTFYALQQIWEDNQEKQGKKYAAHLRFLFLGGKKACRFFFAEFMAYD